MSATPIRPGRVYRVRHNDQTYTVLAAHPCDAIMAVLVALQ